MAPTCRISIYISSVIKDKTSQKESVIEIELRKGCTVFGKLHNWKKKIFSANMNSYKTDSTQTTDNIKDNGTVYRWHSHKETEN